MRYALLALILFLGSLAACGDASGTLTGGDLRYDAPPPISPPAPPPDAGDAGIAADAGHAWTDLYHDYFGDTGAAACSGGTASCHGTKTGMGYLGSNYLCPPMDKDGCYAGITNKSILLLTQLDGGTAATFAETTLYQYVLRKQAGGPGNMPKAPPYAFSEADIARMAAWFTDGIPDN